MKWDWKRQPGIENSPAMMKINIRKITELRRRRFVENDRINFMDILIGEFLLLPVTYPPVLPQHQVGNITGDAFPGKQIADLLNLHVSDTPIGKLDNDICDQKRTFIRQTYRIIGEDLPDTNLLFEDQGKKSFQPFRNILRVEDFLEVRIIKNLHPPNPGTVIQKPFLLVREPGRKCLLQERLLMYLT